MNHTPLKLTQISPHVWILPHHPDKNRVQAAVGIVLTPEETVLIDSGNSLSLARRLQAALAQMAAPPISRIIYTHHHWDHTFGACIFGSPVVAHRLSYELLSQMKQQNVGDAYLRTKIERNPRLILDWTAEDWDRFEIVLPEQTFAEQARLQVGDLSLELRHVGGVHAADSTVITVVEDGVMFLGDSYYPAPAYENPTDQMLDMAMLESLLDERVHTYIDGHNSPMQTRHVKRILRSQALLARLNETRPT